MNVRYAIPTAVLIASVVALAQGPRRDGKWEVTMQMDMPGMPNMPPMTTTQCITPKDAADPMKAAPMQGRGGRGNAPDCKMSDYKMEGNKVSWSMKCEGQMPMNGTGEIVYAENTYNGTMKMDMGGRSMTMKYTGRRLGDCTESK